MDQAKTALPHFLHTSKFSSNMWKLKVHLVGVIVHGVGIYGFFDLFEFKHSTNLTLTVLMEIFIMLKDSLPPTLYLQMDNCWKENKNQFMLAFFCLLVEKKIFKKVKIDFLMVGHTHEDVDQVFSRFSSWLKRHSALCLKDMMEAFEKSYTPSPTSIRTEKVFNITPWLAKFADVLTYQSKPHAFKIVLGEGGHAQLLTKKWATDKVWMKTKGNAQILMSLPKDGPSAIPPDYSLIIIDKLKSDVQNSFQFFDNDQAKDWWVKFLDGDSEDILQETNDTWSLPTLQEAKEQSDRAEETLTLQASQLSLDDEDEEIPAVYIGKKSKKIEEQVPEEKQAEVAEGDLCLTDYEKYNNEWPQMAKILAVYEAEGQAEVEWFKGCKSGPWKPCTVRCQGEKGPRFVPFTELVPLSCIWLWGFELTAAHVLPTKVKKAIDSYKQGS